MIELKCEFCPKIFFRPVRRRFCSKECHSEAMRLPPKDCPQCHSEFRPEKSTQKFCSLQCFNASAGGARDQPEPPPVPGARWIPLTQGKFTLVDEDRFFELSVNKWLAIKGPTGHWYAKRVEYRDGKRRGIYMHNEILQTPSGFMGDHRDGDGLNNRGTNLRISTNSQNLMNIVNRSSTGYKGVCRVRGGKFTAKVMASGFKRYLGRFEDPEDAARAYDDAAREMHGPNGRYNFPRSGELPARS